MEVLEPSLLKSAKRNGTTLRVPARTPCQNHTVVCIPGKLPKKMHNRIVKHHAKQNAKWCKDPIQNPVLFSGDFFIFGLSKRTSEENHFCFFQASGRQILENHPQTASNPVQKTSTFYVSHARAIACFVRGRKSSASRPRDEVWRGGKQGAKGF